MIGQAAAVQGALVGAGLSPAGVAWWWRQPREQLGGLTPRELALRDGGAAGGLLLELARADVSALERELPAADELDAAAAGDGIEQENGVHGHALIPGGGA